MFGPIKRRELIMTKEKNAQVSTTPKSPLDEVLLHFPEVRTGHIVGRVGMVGPSGSGIEWTFRLPDASYWLVRIGFNKEPKKTQLDPEMAEYLERVWQEMGDDAIGEEVSGWKWASREFFEITEEGP
jgi:hypothetical protein